MIRFDISCDVCGRNDFQELGQRADGIPVICCSDCGHGVVRYFTEDVAALYGDEYFWKMALLWSVMTTTLTQRSTAWLGPRLSSA